MADYRMYFLAGGFFCVRHPENPYYNCQYKGVYAPPDDEEVKQFGEKYATLKDRPLTFDFQADNFIFDGATRVKVQEWVVEAHYMLPFTPRLCKFNDTEVRRSHLDLFSDDIHFNLVECGLSVEAK